ncbi:hypothetical protein MTO96_010975 [Rhipicephalus appendiculatus]
MDMAEAKNIGRDGKEYDDYETTVMARLLRASSKGCQTNLPSTCTQETQTQEVDEGSGAELPDMPSRCEFAKRLKSHQQSSHKHKCSRCHFTTDTKANLEEHEVMHKDHRVVCIICGRRFSNNECLEVHKQVHTAAKLYECDVCGQCFNVLSNMKRHRNLHSGAVGPHTCPDCGRAFHQKSHLRSHLRTHTGERPFQCSQCNERFTEIGSARKHERMMHAGQYPHYCPHCSKGLANTYKLRKHVEACYRRIMKEDANKTT